MPAKLRIHVIDSDSKRRAAIAQAVFALDHHAELYADLGELAGHLPRDGLVIAHEDAMDGGVAGLVRLLDRARIWLGIIALSSHPTFPKAVAAIRAGALDYLTLPLEVPKLAQALDTVCAEMEKAGRGRTLRAEAARLVAGLSPREASVLALIADGMTNREIADKLGLSSRTVDIHRANVISKLGARNSAAAVRIFMMAGCSFAEGEAESFSSAVRAA